MRHPSQRNRIGEKVPPQRAHRMLLAPENLGKEGCMTSDGDTTMHPSPFPQDDASIFPPRWEPGAALERPSMAKGPRRERTCNFVFTSDLRRLSQNWGPLQPK